MKEKKTKLSEHIFKKGKFITPWNNALGDLLQNQSWTLSRLPEFFWIALILDYYGRENSINMMVAILNKLHDISNNIEIPFFSQILKLEKEKQELFFSYLCKIINPNVLSPLTLIYTYSDYPIFTKFFHSSEMILKDRKNVLESTLKKCYGPQTDFTTDIKFWSFYLIAKNKKLIFSTQCEKGIEAITNYMNTSHDDDRMHTYRPMIRALEGTISSLAMENINNEKFLNEFWERISIMSDCNLYTIKFELEESNGIDYINKTKTILIFLTNLFVATNPLNQKMLVILGLLTYAYKIVLEVVEHNLYNTIIGRNVIRCLVELYIMLKYLLKKEKDNLKIWEEFQEYGIGQFKTVLARSRDFQPKTSNHVSFDLIDVIVNEYKREEFLNMDTSYFDKQNMREKANFVGEKELYGLYYDYDSAYEHGLWGAIRESSVLNCDNPSHQYHFVPDYENQQKLKSIWPDCIYIMNKIIDTINSEYEIPRNLLKEVKLFEQADIK